MPSVVPFEDPANYRRVMIRVRKLWEEGEVQFREHAQRRMRRYGYDVADVQHIITSGSIIEHGRPKGSWRWKIQGTTVEGETASCVVEIDGRLVIVTVINAWREE